MMAISMPLSFRSLYMSTGVPSAAFPKGWGFNSGVLDSLFGREHDATAPAIVIPKVRLSIFTLKFNLLQMASVVIIQEPPDRTFQTLSWMLEVRQCRSF